MYAIRSYYGSGGDGTLAVPWATNGKPRQWQVLKGLTRPGRSRVPLRQNAGARNAALDRGLFAAKQMLFPELEFGPELVVGIFLLAKASYNFV